MLIDKAIVFVNWYQLKCLYPWKMLWIVIFAIWLWTLLTLKFHSLWDDNWYVLYLVLYWSKMIWLINVANLWQTYKNYKVTFYESWNSTASESLCKEPWLVQDWIRRSSKALASHSCDIRHLMSGGHVVMWSLSWTGGFHSGFLPHQDHTKQTSMPTSMINIIKLYNVRLVSLSL